MKEKSVLYLTTLRDRTYEDHLILVGSWLHRADTCSPVKSFRFRMVENEQRPILNMVTNRLRELKNGQDKK